MFNLSIVKEHPLATGAIVIVGGLIVYLAIRHGSPAVSGGSALPVGLTGSDLQLANLNAAQNLSAAQYGAQVTTAQIAGQVASQESSDQLKAVQAEADSALAIVQTQTSGAVQATQINADATTEQTAIKAKAATDIAAVQFGDELQAVQSQVNGAVSISNNSLAFKNSVITAAARDKSRSSTGYTQIISALNGQGPEAIAANQPSAVASSPAGIIGSIAGPLTSFFSGLF